MDVKTQLRIAVSTGEVLMGSSQTLKAVKSGKAKLIILTSKCPKKLWEEVRTAADRLNIPVYVFEGDGKQLGAAAGKPFPVSALTVKKPGDSRILELAANASTTGES